MHGTNVASAALLLLTAIAAIAGTPLVNPPQDLTSLLEPIRKKHDLPALAGAIVTSDGLIGIGAVGVRKYGSGIPVTVNDEFHLGSDTKAMTATLLAMLVEEGKLNWDTPLETALADLAAKMNPAYRKVTIEQLLGHRAGFTDESWPKGKGFRDMQQLPGSPREQRAAYVAMILAEPPVNTPGSAFVYSNRSFVVAGVIAEKIANDAWENLMQKRLFQPLGMDTCGFGAMGTPGKIDQPWGHSKTLWWHRAVEPGPDADNPPVLGPAGTVHCSVGDWAKFVQAHLRGEKGEPGLLKPETFKRLHTAPAGWDYAYGWGRYERPWAGGDALTHAGSNTMNFAVVWMAPLKDFAVLVMTNQAGGDTPEACDETAAALIQSSLKK